MGLKIYWTDFSKSELRQIFDYYKEIGMKLQTSLIPDSIRRKQIEVNNIRTHIKTAEINFPSFFLKRKSSESIGL